MLNACLTVRRGEPGVTVSCSAPEPFSGSDLGGRRLRPRCCASSPLLLNRSRGSRGAARPRHRHRRVRDPTARRGDDRPARRARAAPHSDDGTPVPVVDSGAFAPFRGSRPFSRADLSARSRERPASQTSTGDYSEDQRSNPRPRRRDAPSRRHVATVSRATGLKTHDVSRSPAREGISRRRAFPGTLLLRQDRREGLAVSRAAPIGEMRAAFNVSKQAIYQAIARWGLR